MTTSYSFWRNPHEILIVKSIFTSRKPLFRIKSIVFLDIPASRIGSGYIAFVPCKNLTKSGVFSSLATVATRPFDRLLTPIAPSPPPHPPKKNENVDLFTCVGNIAGTSRPTDHAEWKKEMNKKSPNFATKKTYYFALPRATSPFDESQILVKSLVTSEGPKNECFKFSTYHQVPRGPKIEVKHKKKKEGTGWLIFLISLISFSLFLLCVLCVGMCVCGSVFPPARYFPKTWSGKMLPPPLIIEGLNQV